MYVHLPDNIYMQIDFFSIIIVNFQLEARGYSVVKVLILIL